MNEPLGIVEYIQATRDRFPDHVARHDRQPKWREFYQSTVVKPVVVKALPPRRSDGFTIMAKFCEVYSATCIDLTVGDLKSPKRPRRLSYPRHICMYLVRNITGASLPQIGALFRRDHTSVLYAVLHAEDLMAADPALRNVHDRVAALFAAAPETPTAARIATVAPVLAGPPTPPPASTTPINAEHTQRPPTGAEIRPHTPCR